MFTRIVVATDFSEPSEAALDYAKGLAGRFCASLHLIHVVDDAVVGGVFGTESYFAVSPALTAARSRDAELALEARLSRSDRACLRATTEVISGPVATAIVTTASRCGADLIVMGTHGRTGLAHALMGSVAEHVVRTAHCPVLTVHGKPPQYATIESNWTAATAVPA